MIKKYDLRTKTGLLKIAIYSYDMLRLNGFVRYYEIVFKIMTKFPERNLLKKHSLNVGLKPIYCVIH